MMVAVAPDKFSRGVLDETSPWIESYEIVDLRSALRRVYATDAHCVCYVLQGLQIGDRQPRAMIDGMSWLSRRGRIPMQHTVMVDVDNHAHGDWTEEEWESTLERLASLTAEGFGWYRTTHGLRLVQPLASPVPWTRAEGVIRAVYTEVEEAGFSVDWITVDRARHYRMPNVVRSGTPYTALMDID